MKRKDLYLIVGVIILGIIAALIMKLTQKDGSMVVVTVKGQVYKTVSLKEEKEIQIETEDGLNIIEIHDGEVSMKEADCPDQVCVKHSKISKTGETIVCLPHEVVVEITSDEQKEIDSVA